MGNMKVCFGLYGLQDWYGGDFSNVLELAKLADEKGIDQVSITDHVIMGENTDRYPYGGFPAPFDYPWFEPLTVLSTIAGCTKNIGLSTGILVTPPRPAAVLAKQLATLDHMSKGRVQIGIGTGWQEEEYIATGVAFEDRWELMQEQVRVMRLLWSEAPASFSGKSHSFDKLYSVPFPTQAGGIPVWYGVAANEKNVERIAELGNGWIPMTQNPKKIKQGTDAIKEAMVKAGRDPETLDVRVQPYPIFKEDGTSDIDATLDQVSGLLDAGVTMIEMLPLMYCKTPDDIETFFDKLVAVKAI